MTTRDDGSKRHNESTIRLLDYARGQGDRGLSLLSPHPNMNVFAGHRGSASDEEISK